MRKLILILAALACLSASAQNLKKTFTGTAQGFNGIPAYQEGKDFYLNPYPGGQSGNLVIVKLADKTFRIWDNLTKTWFTEPMENVSVCLFMNPNMFFVGKTNDRCGIYFADILDGFKAEDKQLMFTDWRFHQNGNGELDCMLFALGGKWGVMGPNGHFLVPTRYDKPEEALAALKERAKAEKPLGMSEMDFLVQEFRRLRKEGVFDCVHLDWQWYDPVNGALFYTIEELPWAGPYIRFIGNFDYIPDTEPEAVVDGDEEYEDEEEPVVETSREVIYRICLGIEDDVLSFIVNPAYYQGKMLPLSFDVLGALTYDPVPIEDTEGDLFYGFKLKDYGVSYEGMRLNRDGSFQNGYFIIHGYEYGPVNPFYQYVPGDWRYEDFLLHYVASQKNIGKDPTEEEALEEFRKRLCTDYYNDRFSIWNTFAENGTIKVFVEPLITLEIPTTRANAAKFVKDYEKYVYDRYKFDTKIERAVRDDGEVYVTYLRITSPSGAVLEYFGE